MSLSVIDLGFHPLRQRDTQLKMNVFLYISFPIQKVLMVDKMRFSTFQLSKYFTLQ